MANSAPTDINASNLTIAENSAIGTVIGEFNATDPDGDTNITYSLLYSSGNVGWTSSRFYGDADSGINYNYKYTCAVNVGGEGVVVNGVPFEGSNSLSGNGWVLTSGFMHNWIDTTSSSNPSLTQTNVSGNAAKLLQGFRFGGNPQKIKLTNLQIGATYVFSTYNQAFGTSERRSTLSSTAYSSTSSVDQNVYGAGDDDGLLVRYTYIANTSEVEFTFDPATEATWHLYAFSNHELAPFSIDENGTLTTNRSFDYENIRGYSITVQATDDLNASSTQTFTVQITNVVEDLDGDGTEDPFDDDIDGDGVSNANEILYSSDPLDAGSTNSPPFSFSSSSLTVAENSSIGTVVGEFNGTSSNSDDNFTFRILPDAPDGFSPLLWLDAADPFTLYSEMNRTNHALSGAVAGWADKSGRDQHFGQSTSSACPSTGNRMFNGLNVLDFNGTQWMKSNEDFATGTDFSIYMFAKIDAVASEWDSLF
ncbi:MAG: cadherin repeat domain-containing protein, partial [Opitutae bacterium]